MKLITVSELAESINQSIERFLEQMKDAGLFHNKSDALVSDLDKKKL